MSGVIDSDGVQWEHCNICGAMVPFDTLRYGVPTAAQIERSDAAAKAWAEAAPNRGWRPKTPGEKLDLCAKCATEAGVTNNNTATTIQLTMENNK